MRKAKALMRRFREAQVHHVPRDQNKDADHLASSKLNEPMVGAVAINLPLQQGKEDLEDIMHILEQGEAPKHLNAGERRWLARKATRYRMVNDDLYCLGKDGVLRRVPLRREIEEILKACHDDACGGHFAHDITSRKILQAGFTWPSLHRDVKYWCQTCDECQKAGPRRLIAEPQNPIKVYGPFEKWGIDAIGPLPRTQSGKEYIIMGVDYMTRWAEAIPTNRITAKDVSQFIFDHICCRFGTPLEILCDRGPGFRADLVGELMQKLKIQHQHSTPYYPQCNGLVEKVNGIICKILTKQVHARRQDWDKHLNGALWAYRTSFKTTLGYTPFHLVYGKEALLPIEVKLTSLRILGSQVGSQKEKVHQRIMDLERLQLDREEAINHYSQEAEKRREKFNKKLASKNINKGSLVLRYDNRFDTRKDGKFLFRWEGPFLVTKKFKNGSYRLQDIDGKVHRTRTNGWRLKPYHIRIRSAQDQGK